MATAKKNEAAPKKTPTQLKKEIEELQEEITRLKDKIANGGYCRICGRFRHEYNFHGCTDPIAKGKLAPICKDCAKDIALRKDINGEYHEPTKESIQLALMYLDKPFYEDLYNSSVNESLDETSGNKKNNAWGAYIKNVAMPQYNGLTYKDSDMFKQKIIYEDEQTPENIIAAHQGQDTYSDYMKNKKDVTRLLGYDPFEKEALSDQPAMYSQLLGLLDSSEDANDDMMRTASCISIVRNFVQQGKIDDTIAKLMSNIQDLQNNSATIKSLQDSKGKITGVIKDLAAESCISLKNNKNAKKGENTWTGKIKKIKELNLREGEVNGFDMATCKAMKQVMDLSNQSIMTQLALDESEWSDIVADQRTMIVDLQDKLDKYIEISRILLRENLDIKDTLQDRNIDLGLSLVNLNELFSCFSGEYTAESDGESDEV